MIKILHSADWHLDSPLQGRSPQQAELLRRRLREIPERLAALCRKEGCDLMLLSGDLFDGSYTSDSYQAVRNALETAAVPVFIAPGNHDFSGPDSPWLTKAWPENVHIFTQPFIKSVSLPDLNCRVYGAGYTSMDCPGLLEGFQAECEEHYAIGVFHGDPTQTASPYCPVTNQQVQQSGLDYLALGHIHKQDAFRAGKTLCAWPGCPQGRGFDEQGQKGVLIVTVEAQAEARFVPLEGIRFYDLEVTASEDMEAALGTVLPIAGSDDCYRITVTGDSLPLDMAALTQRFSQFPNLELRDRTTLPVDLWSAVGEDTLEGLYFKLLQEAMAGQDVDAQRQIQLAAKISRQILDGQEVVLP